MLVKLIIEVGTVFTNIIITLVEKIRTHCKQNHRIFGSCLKVQQCYPKVNLKASKLYRLTDHFHNINSVDKT